MTSTNCNEDIKSMKIVKSVIIRLIIITMAIAIAFFISEFAIRFISPQMTGPIQFAFDAELGEIPVPNQIGRRRLPGNYDYTYSNNSKGFRGKKEYNYEKNVNLRVLILGDSFAYGIGVDDEQTVGYYLENNILTFFGSVEVINASNGGKGTDYELKVFQTLGYKYQPDLTVLAFFRNDFEDNERGQYYIVSNDGKVLAKDLSATCGSKKAFLMSLPGYNWLISWSHAANLIKAAILKYIKSKMPTNSDFIIHYREDVIYRSNEKNIKLTNIYLDNLNKAIILNRGKLVIFYIPSP